MAERTYERVVLVDDDGIPVGTAAKADVHRPDTPLHLAFSCHLVDAAGRVLITRRSLTKATWPGVWSNSFCGHPGPGEALENAVRRRARFELGVELSGLRLALPRFRYRAVDASGVVENEICPVFVAHAAGPIAPRPDEVMEFAWVSGLSLGRSVRSTPAVFSPWLVLQARRLVFLGGMEWVPGTPRTATRPEAVR